MDNARRAHGRRDRLLPLPEPARRQDLGCAIRAHYVRDVTLGKDASRIRARPGVMARARSVALNVLRVNGVQDICRVAVNRENGSVRGGRCT